MKFIKTSVAGAWVLEPEPISDERGFFARLWCAEALAENGLSAVIAQTNLGFSEAVGTLRGLHLQSAPWWWICALTRRPIASGTAWS